MPRTTRLIDLQCPPIAPVPAGTARPLWSVMIPTYNSTTYLAETLKSILVQDPGPEVMQIEVIDNCSTQDDPEPLVRELGQGRIALYRQAENVGMIGNFNTCLERARGEVVHVLHNDDYVAPDFYEHFTAAIRQYPEVDLFLCRYFEVDEQSEINLISPRLPALEKYPNEDFSICFYQAFFGPPSTVIRRRFFEKFGGFSPIFQYTDDWEMYTRALVHSGGLMINKPLAYYRCSTGNSTHNQSQQGRDIQDLLLLGEVFANRCPNFDQDRFNGFIQWLALDHAINFFAAGNLEGARNNARLWRSANNTQQLFKQVMVATVRRDFRRLATMRTAL